MGSTSDYIILLVSFVGLLLIFGGVYYMLNDDSGKSSKQAGNSKNVKKDAEVDVVREKKKPKGPRRLRVGNDVPIDATPENIDDEPEANDLGDVNTDDQENENVDEDESDQQPKTKKELLKLEKKRQKREEKELEETQRTAKQEKQAKRDAKQQQKDLEREEEERKRQEQEEEARKKKEEKEKEDYDKWKDLISVESSGSDETQKNEQNNILEEFIKYIKKRKVVVLEDLAIEFGLPAAQCVNRVQQLEELGHLSGVIDDRGKFIYLSPDELNAVAKFVQRRGRISIADLAIESNKLINLKESIDEELDATIEVDENSNKATDLET